ncbi:hypothetical protein YASMINEVIRUS_1089 [Yasminevirus sp. GU-2018]|uniref:Uncharacterized protein n=1 Tax=Yasminevirus sp. GU-2018 TaxID=2420051 RepID=A0A5K0U9H3_9VIRU|nr:hypothetical protein YASMINEVIRUS_1089 [Yasminevirus sp. GU-2018]
MFRDRVRDSISVRSSDFKCVMDLKSWDNVSKLKFSRSSFKSLAMRRFTPHEHKQMLPISMFVFDPGNKSTTRINHTGLF